MGCEDSITFCTVCKNRLEHLCQTLIANIDGNCSNNVRFVLLDYNSTDGLEDWVKRNLSVYIWQGKLDYYKYPFAKFFHRTHSRNMAMILADTKYICNVDADNYLGSGFAAYMVDLLGKNEGSFATCNYDVLDTIGRVCLRKEDFVAVRGYNECFEGYGFEDLDLYNRLQKSGVRQLYIDNPDFYTAIPHSDKMRVGQEEKSSNISSLYIHYVKPYLSDFLLVYTNGSFMAGQVVNNYFKLYDCLDNEDMDINQRAISESCRILLTTDVFRGVLSSSQSLQIPHEMIVEIEGKTYHKIVDDKSKNLFLKRLSEAMNYSIATSMEKNNLTVNPHGYGKGYVYKNFDMTKPIWVGFTD